MKIVSCKIPSQKISSELLFASSARYEFLSFVLLLGVIDKHELIVEYK